MQSNMKKIIPVITLCICFFEFSFGVKNTSQTVHKTFHLSQGVTESDYMKNVVILKLKPEFRTIISASAISHPALSQYLNSIGETDLKKKSENPLTNNTFSLFSYKFMVL